MHRYPRFTTAAELKLRDAREREKGFAALSAVHDRGRIEASTGWIAGSGWPSYPRFTTAAELKHGFLERHRTPLTTSYPRFTTAAELKRRRRIVTDIAQAQLSAVHDRGRIEAAHGAFVALSYRGYPRFTTAAELKLELHEAAQRVAIEVIRGSRPRPN